MEFHHVSVLLEECLEGLAIRPDGTYMDGTAGGAGHSREIARRLTTGRLFSFDQDPTAVAVAKERLAGLPAQVVHSNFRRADTVLRDLGVEGLDGALLDLGVSSHQLDERSRGFSYLGDAPLDMRMDNRASLTAETVVNEYSEDALLRILRDYGEETFAPSIVRRIALERRQGRITTCGQLRAIIEESVPAKYRYNACARKTFQAIRIEVNGELDGLKECVEGLTRRLKKGGRACILTFHSLEDRIVKNVFRSMSEGCTCPKSFPVCVCGKKKEIEIITRKPLTAGEGELEENSRAKSAKLRIAEKIGE